MTHGGRKKIADLHVGNLKWPGQLLEVKLCFGGKWTSVSSVIRIVCAEDELNPRDFFYLFLKYGGPNQRTLKPGKEGSRGFL